MKMKFYKAIIFLSILIVIFGKKHSLKKVDVKKSTLYVAIEDTLTSIKINGNDIIIPQQDKVGWTKTRKYDLGLLPGDTISISGENLNKSKFTNSNPAGIMVTLFYVAPDGKKTKILSDDINWKCDGEQPLNLKKNGDKGKLWNRVWQNIDKEAVIIWGKKKNPTTTCTYTITCEP